ncbi:MAG: endonuclease MutS2 [Nitrospirae bacterium]|nr:endonuclease MutS2 [Nitrospirota bacterium]
MTIPSNTFKLLEFDKLLSFIADYSNSEASRNSVLKIHPMHDKDNIENRFRQIAEIRKLSNEGNPLKLSPFTDISDLISKIRPEGSVLDASELSEFIPVLSISYHISEQMKNRFDLPFLKKLTDHLTGFPDILEILEKSIDSEGNILDSASYLIAELRGKIRTLEGRIRKNLEEIIRDSRISVFLQDNFITTRSGRWVIPVRMDSKGMVQGVVHDVSKSGETAFIEPLGIINLTNELENLRAEHKAEEIRILRNLCSIIRNVIHELQAEFKTIVYLDVLNCIAKFSDLLEMENPQINTSDSIHLIQARHPLLQLTLQRMGNNTQKIVPLDVRLGTENTVMVITGANAGGKTIAIKTIGLLLLMALSGMPVPAKSSTAFPIVQNVLVDIGDEQSIETNLSTFSAHISNISDILKKTTSKTVILIDELGTGTDPEEGAALSCAILQEMRKKGALVFATTHLSEIKGFVHKTEGMINASMEFDQKMLTPLYRLRIGEPGQSHALEIATRYGLPKIIIETAKKMLGTQKIDFDRMIVDLHEKRMQYEKLLEDLRKQHSELDKKSSTLIQKTHDFEKNKKEILANAYKEALDIISATKRQMNTLLDELKKKGRAESRKIIKQIDSTMDSVLENLKKHDKENNQILTINEINKGDIVFVRSLGHDAMITDINSKQNRVKVITGNLEIEIPLSDLSKKRGDILPLEKTYTLFTEKFDKTVSSRLNLVGLRVDEAISKLEHFINHASLSDLREITIIHGIGKGLLMKAIHEHLSNHPLIVSFRSGTPEEGGIGVTIIKLS